MTRYLSSSRGFMSSSEPIIHFGLGEHDQAEKITIYWSSGLVQTLYDIPAGFIYTISEKQTKDNSEKQNKVMFKKDRGVLATVKHSEKFFDDFKREKLLPNKLSQLGSGIAWGDIDNDGDDDVYIGGASGFPGRIYVNSVFIYPKVMTHLVKKVLSQNFHQKNDI